MTRPDPAPLVLIPGMMCDARMWGGIDARIGAGTPGGPRAVIHHVPRGADDMAALAALFLAAAPPRFALAGLSMGGILAMEILHQAPGRVERLALLDTNPRAELPEVAARRAPQIERAQHDLAGVMTEAVIPNFIAPASDGAALAALCLDMALTLGPQVFAEQSLALRGRADRQATLGAYRGPALVLTGSDDRPCPMDRHLLMHRLMPQSRLVVIEGAGHLTPLDNPDATAAAVRDWLEAA